MNLASIKVNYEIKISLYKRLRKEINMLQKIENIVFLNCLILLCSIKHMF